MSAPRASRKPLGAILVERGAVGQADVDRALAEQMKSGGHLGEVLIAMGKLDRQALQTALGVQAGLDPVDLDAAQIPAAVAARLDAATCALFRAVPLREEGRTLVVALADPLNVNILQDLSFIVGGEVRGVIATEEAMDRALQRLHGAGAQTMAAVVSEVKAGAAGIDLQDSRPWPPPRRWSSCSTTSCSRPSATRPATSTSSPSRTTSRSATAWTACCSRSRRRRPRSRRR